MPLPGDLTTIIVTGAFLDFFGNPLTGSVTFDPGVELTDSTGKVIVGTPTVAVLSGAGTISEVLVCTDNANLNSSFTYTITTALSGVRSAYPGKALPHTLGSTVDLTALLP